MAALDKTYVHSWEDYCKVREWANSHTITYSDGEEVSWGCILYQVTEEEFNDYDLEWGFPIWNTSQYEDAVLFRDCPLDIVQNRLREQYSNPEEDLVIDTPPDYKVATKFIVDYSKAYNNMHYFKSNTLWAEVFDKEGYTCGYYCKTLFIPGSGKYKFFRGMNYEYNGCYHSMNRIRIKGRSINSVIRHLRKYNIPSGYTVRLTGGYVAEEWTIKCL